jgi:hypothetical protein
MKRIGAISCLIIFLMTMTIGFAAAATEFKVDEVYPKDGATDMAMENMGFKVFFSSNVYKHQKENKKLCSITDNKGKEVPSLVVCNPKEKNVMMILADTNNKKTKIKGKTKYTVKIKEGFKADNGDTLDEEFKSSFTTLNPSTSMWISMGMMAVMIVAMVFFSTREAKTKAEKESIEKNKKEKAVNPYKEAKKTGKSVEEIVAAEEKKKAKREAKRERQKRENKVEIASSNIKVKKRAPISAVGLKYKDPKPKQKTKAEAEAAKKAAQGGKKNTGKKKKKK